MKKFTLIELIVVFATLGVLMSILLPSLRHSKQAAVTTVCLSNLKQVGLAQQIYLTDNQKFPYTGWFIPTVVENNSFKLSEIHMILRRYTSDKEGELSKLLTCPGFETNIDGSGVEESHHFKNEGLIVDENIEYLEDWKAPNPLRAYGKPEHSVKALPSHSVVNPTMTYSIHEIYSLTGDGWPKKSPQQFHGYKGSMPVRNSLFMDGAAKNELWKPKKPYQ